MKRTEEIAVTKYKRDSQDGYSRQIKALVDAVEERLAAIENRLAVLEKYEALRLP